MRSSAISKRRVATNHLGRRFLHRSKRDRTSLPFGLQLAVLGNDPTIGVNNHTISLTFIIMTINSTVLL